jgi:DNA polymerase
MVLSKLIERTTTGTTSAATSDSQIEACETATETIALESNIRDVYTPLKSSGVCSHQNTETPAPSRGSGRKASRLKKSSGTKQRAEDRIVFDIALAGPNQRYMIWSEDGPLLIHNCGYMLGAGDVRVNHKTGEKEATGLLGYAWAMGITQFTLEQSKLSVDTFRREFVEVKEYWYAIEKAAKRCLRTGDRVEFGHIAFDRKGPFMRMILPSGRCLHYCRPRIEDVKMPWGETKASITYEEQNARKQWARSNTHGGKILENGDQSIARDLLAHGMKLAMKEGMPMIRIHVHDQLVPCVPEDEAEKWLKILIQCMEERPWWAKDLPLGSNGFISKMFQKG